MHYRNKKQNKNIRVLVLFKFRYDKIGTSASNKVHYASRDFVQSLLADKNLETVEKPLSIRDFTATDPDADLKCLLQEKYITSDNYIRLSTLSALKCVQILNIERAGSVNCFDWVKSINLFTLSAERDQDISFTAYIDAFLWMDALSRFKCSAEICRSEPSNSSSSILMEPFFRSVLIACPEKAFDLLMKFRDQVRSENSSKSQSSDILEHLDNIIVQAIYGLGLSEPHFLSFMQSSVVIKLLVAIGRIDEAAKLLIQWELDDVLVLLNLRMAESNHYLCRKSANIKNLYPMLPPPTISSTVQTHFNVYGGYLHSQQLNITRKHPICELRCRQATSLYFQTLTYFSRKPDVSNLSIILKSRPSNVSLRNSKNIISHRVSADNLGIVDRLFEEFTESASV